MGRSSFNRTSEERNAAILTAHGKPFTPFWLPEQGLAPDKVDYVRTMGRKALVNVLNYLHFSDRSLLIHMQEAGYPNGYLLAADPEPCLDGEIMCRWPESSVLNDPAAFIRNLVIDDGKSMIIVPLEQPTSDINALKARLPETSYVLSRRQAKRYPCSGVSVALQLKGRRFEGELRDFSPSGFRVRFETGSTFRQPCVNAGDVVDTELKRDDKVLLSGNCSVRRIQEHAGTCEIVLQPSSSAVPVFSKRTVRNPRVRLKPSPTISFEHPLLQMHLQMEVVDICSSGFSVCEDGNECLLFPGMLIPDLAVQYAGSIIMHCSTQVVYRNKDGQGNVNCGIAILDTEIVGYTRLNQLVESALDPCAQVSGEIEPNALWEFFFSTGFIYPKKYHSMQSAKQEFKDNCRKLYQNNSEIAHHFVYQKSGRIFGHLSILRAYERTWIIHHHAGRALERRKSGLMVLRQVMHYFNDFYRLSSQEIDYAMCFFRPENRFPSLIFGGFERQLKNRQICSMDLFSYLPLAKFALATEFDDGWDLEECTRSHQNIFEQFHAKHSGGGLLLNAMSVAGTDKSESRIEALYARNGLVRRTKLYALKHEEQLVALFVVDHSSRGVNFSELLNCIKVIILGERELPWKVLHKAVSQLSNGYNVKKVPVMCYPSTYLETQGVVSNKTYQLWVFRLSFVDAFIKYMQERFRFS